MGHTTLIRELPNPHKEDSESPHKEDSDNPHKEDYALKDNKNTRTKQADSRTKLRPNAADITHRISCRIITQKLTDDVYAAALLEILYDKSNEVPEEQIGDWLPYNVREIRHATNLTAAEQGYARGVLDQQHLVGFSPSPHTPRTFWVNVSEFRRRLEEELAKEGVIIPEELRET